MLVNETARGVPDEIEEGGKVEEVDDTEGVPSDDNLPIDGKFQFVNCQSVSVYMNAFNTSGVKVEDCGNIFPQFTRMSCFFFMRFPCSSISGPYR